MSAIVEWLPVSLEAVRSEVDAPTFAFPIAVARGFRTFGAANFERTLFGAVFRLRGIRVLAGGRRRGDIVGRWDIARRFGLRHLGICHKHSFARRLPVVFGAGLGHL